MDPAVPHSIDLHAVHTSPSKNFADIMPNEDGTFTYPANFPGYSCITVEQTQSFHISQMACTESLL